VVDAARMDSRSYELDALDLDVIKLELRNDIDLKRCVPEVMRLCAKLDLKSERSRPTNPSTVPEP
jgi:hypothetical protein